MKSKRLFVILISVALAIIIIVAGIFAFTIKEVKGEFSLYNSDAEKIQKDLDEFSGNNLLFFNTDKIVKKIEENPYLEVTSIKKRFPNVIDVCVRERKEVYLILNADKTYILDDEGYVLSEVSADRELDYRKFIVINDFKFEDNGSHVNELTITETVIGEKIKTSQDGDFYKALSLAKIAGLTDCIKSASIFKQASLNYVLFETYTGVTIDIDDIKTLGKEKTELVFDSYKGEDRQDYYKTYYTIKVHENVNENQLVVEWTEHQA